MSSNHNPSQLFRQQSFAVLPNFLDPRERAALRQAADTALAWSRAQCSETSHTTPRISLLTEASSFDNGAAALAPILTFAGSARVCGLLTGIAGINAIDVQLKDAHYYHEQTKRDWDGDWHRDSQFSRTGPELEREPEIIARTCSVHVRVALEDDDRLEIVPASHARWDSDEELAIRRGSNRASDQMPNAVRIVLNAGDACLFHAWSIHRATYRRTPIRRTLDLLYASARPSKSIER